jgi:nitroimidazol reductase NimA-like FMN-containing flavoprotein (pyridoxamine 5'-phosphate oxidase superfamily)
VASWTEVADAAPEIAALARSRIEATGLAFLATLRRDGSPRISGVEPMWVGAELYLGMMPDSRKVHDLHRDPRCCLHNASIDKDVTEGDVKITARAFEVDDLAVKEAIRDDVRERTGHDLGTGFPVFRMDVVEIATIRPDGDHLVIDSWREGQPPRRVQRF